MPFYNLKLYRYEGFDQYRIYSKPIEYDSCKGLRNEKDYNCDGNIQKQETVADDNEKNQNEDVRSKKVSINRTIQTIYEYAYANKWDYFVTLTFDPAKVDRNDYKQVTKKACEWCKNMRNRFAPDLKYLLVPELHKKGGFHIHAVMADCGKMVFEDSGRVAIGKKAYVRTSENAHYPTIYNLGNWRYGWSTATEVKDSGKVSSYLVKYITKELVANTKNFRRFYPSNNLKRAEVEMFNLPYEEIETVLQELPVDYMKSLNIPEAGQSVKYITVKNDLLTDRVNVVGKIN